MAEASRGGGRSARGVGVQRRVGKPPPPGGGRGGALLLFEGVRSFTPETTIAAAAKEKAASEVLVLGAL